MVNVEGDVGPGSRGPSAEGWGYYYKVGICSYAALLGLR